VIAPQRNMQHLGQFGAARPVSEGSGEGLVISGTAAEWEKLSARELIDWAATLAPTGAKARCIGYAGADLVAAQTMEPIELAKLYTPPTPEFQAGMGFANTQFWDEVAGDTKEVLQWVRHGYSEYVEKPIEFRQQRNSTNTSGEHEAFVTTSVQGLVDTGAVKNVTEAAKRGDRDVVRVIAPLTRAVQGNGKERLCWKGRPINIDLPSVSFKMEHAEHAAKQMRAGDFMFTLDMKSGYHQVPVKEWFKKLLCFEWQGQVYQWQVMPFGLSTAPRAYTKICRRLLQRWRQKGVRCSNYIDDFIFFAATWERALEIRAMVLADLTLAGWYISPGKSMPQPGTMVEYLGLVFCSLPLPHIRVPQRKVERAQGLFDGVLKKAAKVGEMGVLAGQVRNTGHHLATALGFLQSLRLAVSTVPVFTRELYACMNTLPKVEEGWFEYGHKVTISEQALAECRFWQRCLAAWNGFVVAPVAVSRVLYTDGSGEGFGALVHRVTQRREEPALLRMGGSWEAAMDIASVMTELQGLWRAVIGAGTELIGQTVLHRTDSISTYAVVSKGGSSHSERLTKIVRRLQVYCMVHDINLAAQYVGSEVIIRSGADLLSRSADVSDGAKLNALLFDKIWAVWGPFGADMFASGATVQAKPGAGKLPYWAMLADGMAAGVDALTADWGGLGRVYAFPPVKLVGKVVRLIAEQRAEAVLVVPKWPSQDWWPGLVELAMMGPVELEAIHVPERDGPMFTQGRRGQVAHPLGRERGWESTKWVLFYIRH